MSTTHSGSPSPTASPPTPTPNYNTNASTLLFGFLVSALSIFAVFMTFAIVWNRLIARRHAIEAMLAMTPPLESPRLRRPKMWDIWIMPDEQQLSPWLDLKPLAAQKCECPVSSSRVTQAEQTTPFWRRPWNRLPPEITYLFYRPIPPTPFASHTDASQADLCHGSDIQVSLLIAMPHASQSTREGMQQNDHMLHEMVFATTNVLYHDLIS